MSIKKNKDDIAKLQSDIELCEAAELNNFLFFAQLRNPIGTPQPCNSLEDVNRYESENGQGSITDHILRVINATTFTETHQWISKFFNNTYTGTDDDNAAIGAVAKEADKYNEQMTVALNN
eukprot:6451622-Amphidinium_carterae.1